MAAHTLLRRQSGCGHERFYCLFSNQEVHLGRLAADLKNGFPVTDDPGTAAHLVHHVALKDLNRRELVVVRGVASGLGHRQQHVMFLPYFKPVYPMQFAFDRD
jgi:hypothetical protein